MTAYQDSVFARYNPPVAKKNPPSYIKQLYIKSFFRGMVLYLIMVGIVSLAL